LHPDSLNRYYFAANKQIDKNGRYYFFCKVADKNGRYYFCSKEDENLKKFLPIFFAFFKFSSPLLQKIVPPAVFICYLAKKNSTTCRFYLSAYLLQNSTICLSYQGAK